MSVGLQPAVDVALAAFGADRLMFGSDWPVGFLSASYEQVVDIAHRRTAVSVRRNAAGFQRKRDQRIWIP